MHNKATQSSVLTLRPAVPMGADLIHIECIISEWETMTLPFTDQVSKALLIRPQQRGRANQGCCGWLARPVGTLRARQNERIYVAGWMKACRTRRRLVSRFATNVHSQTKTRGRYTERCAVRARSAHRVRSKHHHTVSFSVVLLKKPCDHKTQKALLRHFIV